MTFDSTTPVTVGDLTFDVRLAGPDGGETVVLLHGFPETSLSWTQVAPQLVDAGLRVVAIDQRGYSPGARPVGVEAYATDLLVADVIGVVDALGIGDFHVVGHDWGAVTAHTVATLAPHRVRRIVMGAVPHTHTVITKPTPRQLWRSRYMLQFQVPDVPERVVGRDGLRWIDDLVRRWSPEWDPTPDQLANFRAGLEGQGHLSAAIGYYRGIPLAVTRGDDRRIVFGEVPAPTLLIRGEADACMGAEKFDDLGDRFVGGARLASIPGAGHHMHVEAPEVFADHVLAHLTAA